MFVCREPIIPGSFLFDMSRFSARKPVGCFRRLGSSEPGETKDKPWWNRSGNPRFSPLDSFLRCTAPPIPSQKCPTTSLLVSHRRKEEKQASHDPQLPFFSSAEAPPFFIWQLYMDSSGSRKRKRWGEGLTAGIYSRFERAQGEGGG